MNILFRKIEHVTAPEGYLVVLCMWTILLNYQNDLKNVKHIKSLTRLPVFFVISTFVSSRAFNFKFCLLKYFSPSEKMNADAHGWQCFIAIKDVAS